MGAGLLVLEHGALFQVQGFKFQVGRSFSNSQFEASGPKRFGVGTALFTSLSLTRHFQLRGSKELSRSASPDGGGRRVRRTPFRP